VNADDVIVMESHGRKGSRSETSAASAIRSRSTCICPSSNGLRLARVFAGSKDISHIDFNPAASPRRGGRLRDHHSPTTASFKGTWRHGHSRFHPQALVKSPAAFKAEG